jgi:hypothetical protein
VKAAVLVLATIVAAGCSTVDIYTYQPRPLPSGTEPLAVVAWTLHDLRNVSWSYGEPDPDPSRRAVVQATGSGVAAVASLPLASGSPLDLSYAEIAAGIRMITQSAGTWTVYLYDHQNRLIELEFSSHAAARLFLDAATVLARAPVKAVASIKD